MADMHEAAIELQAALVMASARAGMAVFVHRVHPWHDSPGGRDSVAVIAMDAPTDLWPLRRDVGDDLATGRAAWS